MWRGGGRQAAEVFAGLVELLDDEPFADVVVLVLLPFVLFAPSDELLLVVAAVELLDADRESVR